MRRCAAAIARAVVAFLDAVLVRCFLSCFRLRPRPGSADSGSSCREDTLSPRDREVLSDDDQGRNGRLGKGLDDDDGGIDEEELRRECNSMATNSPATNGTFLLEAASSEGCSSDKHYILSPELNLKYTRDLPGVESAPRSALLDKTPLTNSCKLKQVDRSDSPFPTPSVLRDDMQTPGTFYASHRGANASGKRVRIQKQFIYPVLRPIENTVADSIKKSERTCQTLVAKPGFSKSPPFSSPNENASYLEREAQGDVKSAAGQQSYDEFSLLTEKHFFMDSDLNRDVENPTPCLPKTWDGNGIPNTNTRYKEDKKVTWHATPFEERLLKVLSDEEFRPGSRVRGKLFRAEVKAE
ncbi:hypothetical protein PR202_ga14654 [Eleusine coracana subsp. coracana]|uniref:Protein JASON n=1 Tax=Eleusine coracana subsp. coracana TaxID=191504 RepID=A0AAV5CI19_ELECO|nr:hypothetical protein PR202_ga14654 [Eleusine coracana subsp. coracana]